MLKIGCVILLVHSMSLPYYYFGVGLFSRGSGLFACHLLVLFGWFYSLKCCSFECGVPSAYYVYNMSTSNDKH